MTSHCKKWHSRITRFLQARMSFIAIQLSSRFIEEHTCKVRGRNDLERTCRSFRRPADLFSQYDIVAIGPALFCDEFNRAATFDAPPCCLDLLCDYEIFVQESEAHDGIGHYSKCSLPPSVAIVEGGLSGFVAATELLRTGISHITLFDLLDEIRNIGAPPMPYGNVLHFLTSFEVMPFSANQICLSYYLDKFRTALGARFPRAGKDHTILYYRRKRYTCLPVKLPRRYFNGRTLAGRHYCAKCVNEMAGNLSLQ